MEDPDHFQYAKQKFVQLHTTFYMKNIISGTARTAQKQLVGNYSKVIGTSPLAYRTKNELQKINRPYPIIARIVV